MGNLKFGTHQPSNWLSPSPPTTTAISASSATVPATISSTVGTMLVAMFACTVLWPIAGWAGHYRILLLFNAMLNYEAIQLRDQRHQVFSRILNLTDVYEKLTHHQEIVRLDVDLSSSYELIEMCCPSGNDLLLARGWTLFKFYLRHRSTKVEEATKVLRAD